MSEELVKNEMDHEAGEGVITENVQIIDDEVKVEDIRVGSIQAQQVDLRKSAAETINSVQTTARFSAIVKSASQSVDVDLSAIGVAKAGDVQMKGSAAGVILAEDGVNMDLSRSQVILSRGNVVMDKSMAFVAGARKIKAENSNIVFLVTGKLEGDVKPLFGPRESLIFGAVAGLVGGILVLTGHLFKGLGKYAYHRHDDEDND